MKLKMHIFFFKVSLQEPDYHNSNKICPIEWVSQDYLGSHNWTRNQLKREFEKNWKTNRGEVEK